MVLIISGHQRSGTTLLRRLCDSHPEMRVANEFACFADVGLPIHRAMLARMAQWRLVNGRWAFDSAHTKDPQKHWKNLHFSTSYLRKLLGSSRYTVTTTAVANAWQQQFPNVKFAGDKWPQYMPILPQLVAEKQIKAVVIYRDCRDVTSSFLEKVRTDWRQRPWAGDVDSAEKIARNWVNKIEIMEQLADRIHIIQYEMLVAQPELVLTRLGQWLEVDPNRFNWQSVKGSKVGKHRAGLTESELADVWMVAGKTMRRLGYEI